MNEQKLMKAHLGVLEQFQKSACKMEFFRDKFRIVEEKKHQELFEYKDKLQGNKL